jgi:hypothetical protein
MTTKQKPEAAPDTEQQALDALLGQLQAVGDAKRDAEAEALAAARKELEPVAARAKELLRAVEALHAQHRPFLDKLATIDWRLIILRLGGGGEGSMTAGWCERGAQELRDLLGRVPGQLREALADIEALSPADLRGKLPSRIAERVKWVSSMPTELPERIGQLQRNLARLAESTARLAPATVTMLPRLPKERPTHATTAFDPFNYDAEEARS